MQVKRNALILTCIKLVSILINNFCDSLRQVLLYPLLYGDLLKKHFIWALMWGHLSHGFCYLTFQKANNKGIDQSAWIALCCLIHTCDSSFPAPSCESISILNNTIINSKIFWLGMGYLQKFINIIININPKFSGTLVLTTFIYYYLNTWLQSAVAQWYSVWLKTIGPRVRASPASLRCGPWARHIYPSLVLVQPGKNRPFLTERLLIGCKESNQTNKQYMIKNVNVVLERKTV